VGGITRCERFARMACGQHREERLQPRVAIELLVFVQVNLAHLGFGPACLPREPLHETLLLQRVHVPADHRGREAVLTNVKSDPIICARAIIDAMKPIRAILPAALAAIVSVAIPSAHAADARRGATLYELRCDGCHSESVHGRAKRVAHDYDDVRKWVARWNESLKLRWSGEEVEDVTAYLNGTYYRFKCPPTVCKVVSMNGS
jgi:cytochrome c5